MSRHPYSSPARSNRILTNSVNYAVPSFHLLPVARDSATATLSVLWLTKLSNSMLPPKRCVCVFGALTRPRSKRTTVSTNFCKRNSSSWPGPLLKHKQHQRRNSIRQQRFFLLLFSLSKHVSGTIEHKAGKKKKHNCRLHKKPPNGLVALF